MNDVIAELKALRLHGMASAYWKPNTQIVPCAA